MSIFVIVFLILLTCVVFVFSVLFLTSRYKRAMIYVCLGFVVAGFSIYTAGYLSSGASLTDAVSAMFRGIFSTARMLTLNDDYGHLVGVQGIQWLTENRCMKIVFWLCHVAALVLFQIAVISLFGRKLIDNFRLQFGPHKEVYIIKGSDKNALLLAENIVTHDSEQKKPDDKRLIVFLLEEDDDEKKIIEKASHFNGIVQVLDRKHDLPYYLKTAKLGKWNYFIKEKNYYIVLMPTTVSALDNVQLIAEYAKENKIKPEKLDVFAFAVSEWDRKKIEEITQAREKRKVVKKVKEIIDGIEQEVEREIEETKRIYPCTFHIINEIDLLTRQMIEKHPPFKCPGLKFSGGTAQRSFTVMILGFGPVGQSALLRLVMNGQFMGSTMRTIVIDKDIDNLKDCFEHRYPGLKLCCNIDPKNINVQQKDFFALLDKEKDLDYIVAALHGDEMNKQTALDIKHHYERSGKALPFIAVAELNGSLCETKRVKKHEAKQGEKIFVFGSRDEVFKEGVIIRQRADLIAEAINDVYNKENPNRAIPWLERSWFDQESNRASADFIPAMLYLAGKNEEEAIEKKILTNDSSLAEILAQTEHLRWNAFHTAMGWSSISIKEMQNCFNDTKDVYLCRKNPKLRLHICIASWGKLDKISKAYSQISQEKVDFKKSDRDIIKNIPKFLETAKGGGDDMLS